jgi:hypothetical protein
MQYIGESTVSLPQDMNLVPKSAAPASRSRKVNVIPLSGSTFNPGDVAKFEIPVGGSTPTFMDGSQTYLLFQVQNTDGTPWIVDGSCASFIQKLEIYSSSQLIETVNEYGTLYQIFNDSQKAFSDRQAGDSILLGTDYDGSDAFNFSRGGLSVAANGKATFALPIVSGVIGCSLSKMLPLHMLTDLRLEITWANSPVAVVSNTATSVSTNIWKVTFVELAIQCLYLDNEVNGMLMSAHGDAPIQLSTEMYRNYNTVLSGTNSDSTILPLKFTSTKSLLAVYRGTYNNNSYNQAWTTSRKNPFASTGASAPNIQLLAGQTYVPQIPLRSVQEIYAEYNKCFHALGNIHNKTTMNKITYDYPSDVLPYSGNTTLSISGITTGGIATVGTGNTSAFYVGMAFQFATLGNGVGLNTTTTYYVASLPSSTTFGIGTILNGSSTQVNTSVVTTAYTNASTINTDYFKIIPSFVLGFNLDTLYQSSTTAMSGTNTQAGNVFLNATSYSATPNPTRLDVYAHYDAILVIDPSSKQMSIRI